MSKRRWMKVLSVVSAAALAAGTAPALARSDKAPPKPSGTVTVAMTYEVSGFAATVECDDPVTMTLDGESLYMYWEVNALEMNFGPLSGCHGPLIDGSDDGPTSGSFGLSQEADGTVRLGTRFDYYWEYECVTVTKGKKEREECTQKVLDFYEIIDYLTPVGEFDWSPGGGGTLTGTVDLRNYHKDYDDGTWTVEGPFVVTFTVEIGS